MNLFTEQISGKKDWERLFRSIPVFTPLIEHILKKEKLPTAEIRNLTPGTNFVAKTGGFVIKIFAPEESGYKQELDFETELFATQRANGLGIPSPKIIASGLIEDKYNFNYLVTEFIEGVELADIIKEKSDKEKENIGRRLRTTTDKMNTECTAFNKADPVNDESNSWSWEEYPERFRKERLKYIHSYNYGQKVFVHGDLCSDNILLTPQGELFLIDFADAILAPVIYEHALIAIELFELDPALMRGYFGEYNADEMTEICFNGILIQGYGGEILPWNIGKPAEFQCLDDLRKRLDSKLRLSR